MEKTYLPHQQRVVDEQVEIEAQLTTLTKRITDLHSFIETNDMFKKLSDVDRMDLTNQLTIMRKVQKETIEYDNILKHRISLF